MSADRRGVVVSWNGGHGSIRDADTGACRPVSRSAIWPGGLPKAQRRLCPGEHVRYTLSAADEHGGVVAVRGAWHDPLICHRGRAKLRPPPIRASWVCRPPTRSDRQTRRGPVVRRSARLRLPARHGQ